MTWECPNCDRRYPDSEIGLPMSFDADEKHSCRVCVDMPSGMKELVWGESYDD